MKENEGEQAAPASESLWAGLQKRLAFAKRALAERIADGEEQPEGSLDESEAQIALTIQVNESE